MDARGLTSDPKQLLGRLQRLRPENAHVLAPVRPGTREKHGSDPRRGRDPGWRVWFGEAELPDLEMIETLRDLCCGISTSEAKLRV